MALSHATDLLACPRCGEVLTLGPAAARCTAGHAYDVARQGHLNLLGGPQPANADTTAMIEARSRVLSGVYGDLVALVAHTTAATQARVVVDAGAGTGQYLAAGLDLLPDAVGIATDVSVAAARRAASAHPRLASVVADTWRGLPVRTGVAQAVCCVFAPRNATEFARVLSPGGRLVVVTPEPGHLASVRAAYGLLDLDPDKAERLALALAGRFELVGSRRLTTVVDATAEQVADVIAMGPNAFHGTWVTEPTRLEIDVTCRTFLRLEQRAGSHDDLPHGETDEDGG
jgi:23S rRNA (guanine745-N1)-methyltransferase